MSSERALWALQKARETYISLGLRQREAIDAERARKPASRRIEKMEKELHKLRVLLHGVNEEINLIRARDRGI
jgi:type II secretory pathway component PulM